MDLQLHNSVTVILTHAEFRLVSLSLTGSLRRQSDVKAAHELAEKMSASKVLQLEDHLRVTQGAWESIRSKESS